MSATPAYLRLPDIIREGRAASLATVISSALPHVPVGAKLLLVEGAESEGGIHAEIDPLLAADAAELLAQERSAMREYAAPGGSVQVFLESFPPTPRLVIVGAVHVAIPLSKMARILGYRITVVDPRAAFATTERFPDAEAIIVEWPEEAFRQLTLNTGTSIAVLTHDPKIDVPALFQAVQSGVRYIGALGSRSTFAQRKTDLIEMGATEEQIARIHNPIGLNIGSRSPAEIALAVMAEIVAVRRAAKAQSVKATSES